MAGDLDCGQIDSRRFDVIPPDPHQFDLDYDGVGGESDYSFAAGASCTSLGILDTKSDLRKED